MTIPSLIDLASETVASAPGTGTVSLSGTPSDATSLTWSGAGAVSGTVYRYFILDGSQRELCYGTWTSNQLTRNTLIASVNGVKQTTAINASANAIICSYAGAEDIVSFFNLGSGLSSNNATNTIIQNGNTLSLSNPVAATIPTKTVLTSGSGTYTPPAGCLWVRIRMLGGGGAGGRNSSTSGASGGNTTFGTLSANGGAGGFDNANGGSGGGGGSASGGNIVNCTGPVGSDYPGANITDDYYGGYGANSVFGSGGGGGANGGATGSNASGYGAGGGGIGGGSAAKGGGGGGGGGYVEHIMAAASESYSVGAGATGSNGGGNGSGGIIIIEEHYNY